MLRVYQTRQPLITLLHATILVLPAVVASATCGPVGVGTAELKKKKATPQTQTTHFFFLPTFFHSFLATYPHLGLRGGSRLRSRAAGRRIAEDGPDAWDEVRQASGRRGGACRLPDRSNFSGTVRDGAPRSRHLGHLGKTNNKAKCPTGGEGGGEGGQNVLGAVDGVSATRTIWKTRTNSNSALLNASVTSHQHNDHKVPLEATHPMIIAVHRLDVAESSKEEWRAVLGLEGFDALPDALIEDGEL